MEPEVADQIHTWVAKQFDKKVAQGSLAENLFCNPGAMDGFLTSAIREFFDLAKRKKARSARPRARAVREVTFAEFVRKNFSPIEARVQHLAEKGLSPSDIAHLIHKPVQDVKQILVKCHHVVAESAAQYYG